MPKIIYLYTFFIIDCKRSAYDSKVARGIAEWERNNPDKIKIDSCTIPISEKIRENASEIVAEAYKQVRNKSPKKEIIYKTVLTAMLDHNDRFGETFDVFDDFQKEQIRNTCDRVISLVIESSPDTEAELPEHQPGGFTREIMDALDNAVRYRNMYKE